MIEGINNLNVTKTGTSATSGAAANTTGKSGSFSEVLSKSIDEVAKLQQDASQAVQDAVTGKTDDVTGVMTAMEKSDLAFKTLLAIRGKLMEAYEEVKNMSV